jgi:hypothetical protein
MIQPAVHANQEMMGKPAAVCGEDFFPAKKRNQA